MWFVAEKHSSLFFQNDKGKKSFCVADIEETVRGRELVTKNNPGGNVINLFFFVSHTSSLKARAFVTLKPKQPSLTFAIKARVNHQSG